MRRTTKKTNIQPDERPKRLDAAIHQATKRAERQHAAQACLIAATLYNHKETA